MAVITTGSGRSAEFASRKVLAVARATVLGLVFGFETMLVRQTESRRMVVTCCHTSTLIVAALIEAKGASGSVRERAGHHHNRHTEHR